MIVARYYYKKIDCKVFRGDGRREKARRQKVVVFKNVLLVLHSYRRVEILSYLFVFLDEFSKQ